MPRHNENQRLNEKNELSAVDLGVHLRDQTNDPNVPRRPKDRLLKCRLNEGLRARSKESSRRVDWMFKVVRSRVST